MEYMHWLRIIESIFWIAVLVKCLWILLRGRVFIIQFLYLYLAFLFIVLNLYFQNLFLSTGIAKWLFYIQSIFAILLVLFPVIRFNDLWNRYLFWGVGKEKFIEVFQTICKENNYQYENAGKSGYKILQYPSDIYSINSFIDNFTGSTIFISSETRTKLDQCKLLPKMKEALQTNSLNNSSKLFLVLIILLSGFVLFNPL